MTSIAVNQLGNLTLVTDKLNPSLSNAAWQTKRAGLAQHSLLAMNQQLVDSYADRFDERAIRARSEQGERVRTQLREMRERRELEEA